MTLIYSKFFSEFMMYKFAVEDILAKTKQSICKMFSPTSISSTSYNFLQSKQTEILVYNDIWI
jgi:hypothetical protein